MDQCWDRILSCQRTVAILSLSSASRSLLGLMLHRNTHILQVSNSHEKLCILDSATKNCENCAAIDIHSIQGRLIQWLLLSASLEEDSRHLVQWSVRPTKLKASDWRNKDSFLPGVFPHIFLRSTLGYHLISATSIFVASEKKLRVGEYSYTPITAHTQSYEHAHKNLYYMRKQISIEFIADSENKARIINTFNPLQNPNPLGCPKRMNVTMAFRGVVSCINFCHERTLAVFGVTPGKSVIMIKDFSTTKAYPDGEPTAFIFILLEKTQRKEDNTINNFFSIQHCIFILEH